VSYRGGGTGARPGGTPGVRSDPTSAARAFTGEAAIDFGSRFVSSWLHVLARETWPRRLVRDKNIKWVREKQ
jgi:hypothetical protein